MSEVHTKERTYVSEAIEKEILTNNKRLSCRRIYNTKGNVRKGMCAVHIPRD